ncbi:hypothetical protein [uncultured Intestinibacter sp.]|uniref:hypothetical protein n=1 Tax=uncultured Intestinibacter sp. TaxID=1505659 RepID=UPI0027DB40A6|nr:hypothetical protein [uncultured Intestinibacter sp.]
MKNYNYYFNITDILIHVQIPFKITIQKESSNFISSIQGDDVLVKFIEINKSIDKKGQIVYKDSINIYSIDGKFIYEFCPGPGIEPYAWFIAIDEFNFELRYLKGKESYFEYSRNIMEVIDIVNLMNKKNAFLLHSSFIRWNGKAILFSAPSGTGKSTQAELWEKYEDADIINGDKAGVRKLEDGWMAYGLPFAGSSDIFRNEKAPISHIIVLRQGKENKLHRLSLREAFIKIYSETTLHTWDEEFQNNIINMITNLVQNVSIYQYECLPDKSAVDFLKENIIKDDNLEKIYKD